MATAEFVGGNEAKRSSIEATATVETEITALETDLETRTADATTTIVATVTVQPPAPPEPTSGECGALANPFTAANGKKFQLYCSSFFPIQPGGLVGAGNFPLYSDCVNFCASNAGQYCRSPCARSP